MRPRRRVSRPTWPPRWPPASGKPISLSRLESAFIRICEDNDLELPKTNTIQGGRFVDCRWPAHKLTVELDGYRYHSSPIVGLVA